MEFFKTAHFYQSASDEQIEEYENHLDNKNKEAASEIVEKFFRSDFPQSANTIEALRREPGYLDSPPEPGDMVIILNKNHYARLLAVSDDKEIALVKEEFGAYTTPFKNIRRTR